MVCSSYTKLWCVRVIKKLWCVRVIQNDKWQRCFIMLGSKYMTFLQFDWYKKIVLVWCRSWTVPRHWYEKAKRYLFIYIWRPQIMFIIKYQSFSKIYRIQENAQTHIRQDFERRLQTVNSMTQILKFWYK